MSWHKILRWRQRVNIKTLISPNHLDFLYLSFWIHIMLVYNVQNGYISFCSIITLVQKIKTYHFDVKSCKLFECVSISTKLHDNVSLGPKWYRNKMIYCLQNISFLQWFLLMIMFFENTILLCSSKFVFFLLNIETSFNNMMMIWWKIFKYRFHFL
jgi:hypothetical protein